MIESRSRKGNKKYGRNPLAPSGYAVVSLTGQFWSTSNPLEPNSQHHQTRCKERGHKYKSGRRSPTNRPGRMCWTKVKPSDGKVSLASLMPEGFQSILSKSHR